MIKKLSIISGIFFILINFNFAIAHVLHYDKLNKLVFDLYWNNQIIGQHIYIFNREGKHLTVKNTIDIKIKKLGINFYEYFSEGIEIYVDGKFESFASKTNHNKKEKFVNIDKKDGQFYINGSSYKGIAPDNFILGTWWNHSIVKYRAQISPSSGRIIKQKVKFIGKEDIKINNKTYAALKFNFSSSDPSLSKGKKLDTNIWYDKNTLVWLKGGFKKMGDWEYKLKILE